MQPFYNIQTEKDNANNKQFTVCGLSLTTNTQMTK